MKKLLLLSALMLTTNIATAAINNNPCDDLAGEWFGTVNVTGSSYPGFSPTTSRNTYNSQNNQFYIKVTPVQYGPANIMGECLNGALTTINFSGMSNFGGTINNGQINLAGTLTTHQSLYLFR